MMQLLENRFLNRVLHKTLWAAVLPLCAIAGIVQVVAEQHRAADGSYAADAAHASTLLTSELPTQWHGSTLRPLALSDVELRFSKHFPGTVARLTNDKQTLVLRTVNQPTRMLHPATDCYRGLGYHVRDEQLEDQSDHTRWRCFIAERGGRRVRVCEHIEDANGREFTDTSAWYWAAIAGQSTGPWKAITVATQL